MEESPQGEGWGFGDLPAESFFIYSSYVHGGRTYTTRQQVWRPMLPTYPPPVAAPAPRPDADPDDGWEQEEGEGGFQEPVSVTTAYAYGFQGPLQQQQGKRGRVSVSDAAILRLLHEVKVTPTDCCAICLEDFTAAATAAAPPTLRAMPSCSHAFHQHCILQWLCRNAACPVCRHQLPLSLSTEVEEEEEEQRRSTRRRRRSYDDWLSLPESPRAQSPFTREEED